MKIIKHQTSRENPIDTHYKDLKCDLEPMDKSSDKYKVGYTSPTGIIYTILE